MRTRSLFRKTAKSGRISVFLLILAFCTPAYQADAQCWHWAVNMGGKNMESPVAISVDPNGQIAITGEFQGTAIIGNDTLNAVYGRDVFIAGEFQSQFIFNDISYSSEGNLDGFLAKYDISGTPQWAVTGGGSRNEFFNKVAVEAGGNAVYVTGEFESSVALIGGINLQNANVSPPRRDILLMACDAGSTVQWGIRAGSLGHDYANDVAVDGNGDVYITGTFNDTIVFDDISLVNPSGDLYLAKLDSSGKTLWAKQPEVNTALGSGKSVVAYLNRPLIAGDLAAGMAPPILVFDDDTQISNGSIDAFVVKIGQ